MNTCRTIRLITALALVCAPLCAAKYVDPLGGNDANDGSITAPWKTLQNINNLADTVYISNSALCYFGDVHDRGPTDVTLTSWGSARPTIIVSNRATSSGVISLNSSTIRQRIALHNLKLVAPDTGARLIYVNSGVGKTVEIVNCVFDMTSESNSSRRINLRTPDTIFVFRSNLVYGCRDGASSSHFIYQETASNIFDVCFNRFFGFAGTTRGICMVNTPGNRGIVANNTAYGCSYLLQVNQNNAGMTNINNLVEALPGGWWFGHSWDAAAQHFCDFTFSGDSAANTFKSGTIQGPSNVTGLTEAQIKFLNTSDVTAPNFLRIDIGSIAEKSDAAEVYPELDLPPYAGWAQAIPEPALLAALACALLCLHRSRC